MTSYTIPYDNMRLDEIVYSHYGTLSVMADVLNANKNIKEYYNLGDIVLLPDDITTTTKDNTLW